MIRAVDVSCSDVLEQGGVRKRRAVELGRHDFAGSQQCKYCGAHGGGVDWLKAVF